MIIMKNTEEKELFNWEVREEKIKWNKQRELTFIIVGVTAAVVAIIFTYYLATVVIGLALFILIVLGRHPSRIISYFITDQGFLLDEKFYPIKKIREFNIIDDPKEKGRLILGIDTFFDKISVPIYDDDFDHIENILLELKVKKNEVLTPPITDALTRFF